MVDNRDRDSEDAVELRHGGGGGVPIVYHHQSWAIFFCYIYIEVTHYDKIIKFIHCFT